MSLTMRWAIGGGNTLESSRLEEGCVRYVRFLPRGPDDFPNIMCFKTRIHRSSRPEDASEDQNAGRDAIDYIAVSYAWGDPTPKHQIFVDGEPRLIAENLWQFLRQAEEDTELVSEWLWIDALSIDQTNAEERRHQVGIMSRIFSDASEVYVWLGQSRDEGDAAMSVLSEDSIQDYIYHQNRHLVRDSGSTLSARVDYIKSTGDYIEWVAGVSKAIVSLCQRPYWRRLWVFQELRHAVAIKIMCGEKCIHWETFSKLWSVMAELSALNGDAAETLRGSLATRMMTLRAKPIDFSLWNLLKETRNLECLDDRDRVYALLSVATQGHENIEADYRPDVHPVELACHILCNKYAKRPPSSTDDQSLDFEFLADVFRLSETDLFEHWHADGRARPASGRLHRSGRLLDSLPSWSAWARYHGRLAVINRLQNNK